MSTLYIARLVAPDGPRPLVTVRAASEAEALLFLGARYPDDTIEAVTEPGEWVSDADTGTKSGDVREHPGTEWQSPTGAP